MTKKILTVILAIAVITSLSLSTALMAVEMNDYLVIGEGDVTGDPNLNFNSLPETEGIYGVKLDSTDENWKAGLKFWLPSEPVMMHANNKTKHLVDSSFDLLYVLIKAGSIQSGAGDWVFILNPEGDFELLNYPAGSEDHYTITFEDGIITVSQTDRSGVKDVSHISFFFQEGEKDEESSSEDSNSENSSSEDSNSENSSSEDSSSEDSSSEDSNSENSSSEDSSSEDSSYEDFSFEDSVLDESDEESSSEDQSSEESVVDEFFEDEIQGDFDDDEQPDTGTIFVRLLLVGLILLIISVAILYFQRRSILKDY